MKTIGITIITLLFAVPAAGQDVATISADALTPAAVTLSGVGHLFHTDPPPPDSVAGLRALRAKQDGPIVKVNGNTCFVSRAESYAPSCWPSRPEYESPVRKAIVIGAIATAAVIGVLWAQALGAPALSLPGGKHVAGTAAAFGGVGAGAAVLAATED